MVEMSAMGFTLAVCPEKLYEPLSSEAKENLIKWLGGINDKDMPDSELIRFRIPLFLLKVE